MLYNSSLVTGIRRAAVKADTVLDNVVALVQGFVSNATFTSIVGQGTPMAANLLRNILDRKARRCAQESANINAANSTCWSVASNKLKPIDVVEKVLQMTNELFAVCAAARGRGGWRWGGRLGQGCAGAGKCW